VGRKKAERLILDLGDKLDDLLPDEQAPGVGAVASEDAIRALVSLGYSPANAEKAVRRALENGAHGVPAPELIRRALSRAADR
jgi:Holliday junction resolvasome RuvABC DNA-binding subunit